MTASLRHVAAIDMTDAQLFSEFDRLAARAEAIAAENGYQPTGLEGRITELAVEQVRRGLFLDAEVG
jgi:hypothetical protein